MANKKKVIDVEIKPDLSGIRSLNKEIVKMRKELEDATDEKDIKRLNKELGKTEKQIEDINKAAGQFTIGKKFEDVYGDLAPLSSRLGELEDQMYELAFAGQADSEMFRELQAEAVEMRQTIIGVDRQVDILADNKGFSVFGDGIGQVGSSLARLDFETAQKQASSLAGAAGKISFGSAMKSMKQLGSTILQLGKVILVNPLFLLAAVVALIAVGIYKLLDAMGIIKIVFKAVGDAIGWVVQQLKDFLDFLGLTNFAEQDAAKSSAKAAESRAHAYEQASKRIAQALDTEIKLLELTGSNTAKLEQDKLNVLAKTAKLRAKADLAALASAKFNEDLTTEERRDLRETAQASVLANKQAIDDIKIFNATKAQLRVDDAVDRKARERVANVALGTDTLAGQKHQLLLERNLALEETGRTESEILLIQKTFNDKSAALDEADRKERVAKWKTYRNNRLSALRTIQDIEIDLMKTGVDRELETNNLKFDRLIEDTKKNETINQEERVRLIELYGLQRQQAEDKIRLDLKNAEAEARAEAEELEKTRLESFYASKDELEISLIKDQFEKEKAERLAQFEERIVTLEEQGLLTNEVELQIKQKLQDDLNAIDETAETERKARDAKALADAKALSDAKSSVAMQGFQLVSSVAELFADKSERAARIAFNVQKAVSIAQATMDGYKAVLSTYAQTPGGPIIKGLAAGVAGGFAAVQIANIAKTQFDGGGGGASGVASAGSAASGGVQQTQTPNLELFGQANDQNTFFQPQGQEQGQTVQAVISLDQFSTSKDKASQIYESGIL